MQRGTTVLAAVCLIAVAFAAHATACSNQLSCNGKATSVDTTATGCVCHCESRYAGATCGQCSSPSGSFPSCIPSNGGSSSSDVQCSNSKDCNGRADGGVYAQGGVCVCSCTGFAGSSCNRCASGYSGYPNCAQTVCTVSGNCNSQASSVSPQGGGCQCACNGGYAGSACERCDDGWTGYPNCVVNTGVGGVGMGLIIPLAVGFPIVLLFVIFCCVRRCIMNSRRGVVYSTMGGGGVVEVVQMRQQNGMTVMVETVSAYPPPVQYVSY